MSRLDEREELRHRIGRYLDQDLSDEEKLQLEALLGRSEPARRELLMMAMVHHELFNLAGKPAEASRVRPSTRRARRRHPSGFLRGTAIVALIAAAMLLAWLGVAPPVSPRPQTPKESPIARPAAPPKLKATQEVPPPAAPVPLKSAPVPTPAEIEAEVKRAVEEARKKLPAPAPDARPLDAAPPEPEKVQPPLPKPAPVAPRETTVAVATILQVQGQVKVGGETVQAGRGLAVGEGIQTVGPEGWARVRCKDGTILNAEGETEIRAISDAGGIHVAVMQGDVAADVPKLSADQPMILFTPQGEAAVSGASLRATVEAGSTRVTVSEGIVRLKRVADGKVVDVSGGNFAVAAAGITLVARPTRNLLADPRFEKGGRGWRTGPNHFVPPTYVRAGRSGSQALHMLVDDSVCDVYQEVPVKAGAEVQAAAWVRTQNLLTPKGTPTLPAVRLIWLDAKGKVLLRNELGRADSSQDWARCTGRFRVPSQATTVRFQFFAEDGSGTVWLDDCELIPLDR